MNQNIDKHEINIELAFNKLWNKKFTILFITFIFSISSITFSLLLPNKYVSSSTLVLSSQLDSAISSMSQNLGGLASLAGVDIGDSGKKDESLGIEIIKSRSFFEHLVSFDGVMEQIMAAKYYDSNNKKTVFDKKKFIVDEALWVRKPKPPFGVEPTYLEAYQEYIDELLTIYHDKKAGVVEISITHVSPLFANEFLNLIIYQFNYLTREKEIKRSNNAMEYLSNESKNVQNVEVKQSINKLIEEQLKTKMISNMSDEYYFEVIDKPYIPEEKSYPQRSLIVILATFIGLILSITYALTKEFFLNFKK